MDVTSDILASLGSALTSASVTGFLSGFTALNRPRPRASPARPSGRDRPPGSPRRCRRSPCPRWNGRKSPARPSSSPSGSAWPNGFGRRSRMSPLRRRRPARPRTIRGFGFVEPMGHSMLSRFGCRLDDGDGGQVQASALSGRDMSISIAASMRIRACQYSVDGVRERHVDAAGRGHLGEALAVKTPSASLPRRPRPGKPRPRSCPKAKLRDFSEPQVRMRSPRPGKAHQRLRPRAVGRGKAGQLGKAPCRQGRLCTFAQSQT